MAYTTPTSLARANQGLSLAFASGTSSTSVSAGTGSRTFTVNPSVSRLAIGDYVKVYGGISGPAAGYRLGQVTAVTYGVSTDSVTIYLDSENAGTTSGNWVIITTHNAYRLGVHLTWTKGGTPGEYYEVDYSFDGGTTWISGVSTDNQDEAMLGGGIPENTRYRVRANGTDGPTSWSSTLSISVATLDNFPASYEMLGPDLILTPGTNQITFEIDHVDYSGIGSRRNSHFRVSYQRPGYDEVILNIPWHRTSYTLTDLPAGTEYTLRAAQYILNEYTDEEVIGDFGADATDETDAGDPPIDGPTEIAGVVGIVPLGTFVYQGTGTVSSWSVLDAAGLTLTARADTDIADLAGSFTTPGIYDATIRAVVLTGPSAALVAYTHACRFVVSGGAFLSWFHAAPERRDLQFDVRAQTISSEAFNLTTGMRVVRGESVDVHIILRDGARVLPDEPTAFRFLARLKDQPDGEPLIRVVSSSPTTEALGGADRIKFTVTPDVTLCDELFAALNAPAEASGSGSAIECDAELSIVVGGRTLTAAKFPLLISQDLDR